MFCQGLLLTGFLAEPITLERKDVCVSGTVMGVLWRARLFLGVGRVEAERSEGSWFPAFWALR